MTTIVTRAGKGSALSFAEVDGNFTNLNDDKLEKSGGTMTGAITFAAGQTWPTFNQNTTGNAATATALQTPRTINGVSFDGTANITVADATKLPLAGGTLTGAVTFAAGQTFPGTGDVTTTGTQTLTNKTISFSANTLTGVQPTLVSGTNIKTVGGASILGSGDIPIAAGGFSNMVVFTSSGTWSVPAEVTKCRVTVTGGGGGGSQVFSGSGGGTAIKTVNLSGGSATITIGAGGTGGTADSTAGGNSSFVYSGTTVTGNGGTSGNDVSAGTTPNNTGVGGDINVFGDGGFRYVISNPTSNFVQPSAGGGSYWGGGAPGRNSINSSMPGQNYGGGGSSGAFDGSTGHAGGNGAPGVVVIEY